MLPAVCKSLHSFALFYMKKRVNLKQHLYAGLYPNLVSLVSRNVKIHYSWASVVRIYDQNMSEKNSNQRSMQLEKLKCQRAIWEMVTHFQNKNNQSQETNGQTSLNIYAEDNFTPFQGPSILQKFRGLQLTANQLY